MTVLERWTAALVEHRRRTAGIAALVLLVTLVIASGTMSRLQLARFETPGAASVRAVDDLADRGAGTPTVTVLVSATAPARGVDDPHVRRRAEEVERLLRADVRVADVHSYWSTDRWAVMRSRDGRTGMIQARLVGDVTTARAHLADLGPRIVGEAPGAVVELGGRDEVFRQVAAQARTDFGRAEAIVVPGVYLLLVLALRRWGAAALVLGLGLASVVVAMGVLGLVARVTEVSTFAANLILVMGLALGVDYGLFVLARYAEHRRAGQEPNRAAADAGARAGAAVLGSAATVALALLGLLGLPFPFLRSFTYAGLSVVGAAAVLAVAVLPALLPWLDRRLDLGHLPLSTGADGRFARTTRAVMRRPLVAVVGSLLVVGALASPVLGLQVGPPDDRILPPEASSRVVQERIRTGFDAQPADALFIVEALPSEVVSALSAVDGVAEVHARGMRHVAGRPAGAAPDVLPVGTLVVPSTPRLERDPHGLVQEIRDKAGPTLGGYPAVLADYRDALVERLPWVLLWVVLSSVAVLVALTRSVVLPLKAVVVNLLSLAVLGGALVWVFQEGHGGRLVGATATGSLDLSIPILLACVAFGLSMDYEVLLISRVLEEHRSGAGLEDAVARGLQRAAPLITLAGVVLAGSFLAYLTSGVAYLQMMGVGMALVVLLDATLVRLVLVPATLALLGSANWWWPGRRTSSPAA